MYNWIIKLCRLKLNCSTCGQYRIEEAEEHNFKIAGLKSIPFAVQIWMKRVQSATSTSKWTENWRAGNRRRDTL